MDRADPEKSDNATTGAVLAAVNATGVGPYELVRPLAGGFQSGAWLVHDAADRPAVLKWTPDPSWAQQIQRAGRAVDEIRRDGYPTPAWLAYGITTAGIGYQVQEYAPGRPKEHLTDETARYLVDLLERHRDLDPDPARSWSQYVTTTFADEWTSRTAEVSRISADGAALVEHTSRLLSPYEPPTLPDTDLVHGDFRLANLLFDEDGVSAVVDIEALGSGTRAFDYATVLDHERADDDAVELLITAGSAVAGPAALAFCFAHVVLDLALFMRRSPLPATAAQLDQRLAALSARVQVVSRLLI